ncbi:30S ribosome-binding factor RbfA [Aporhodopirellula aestuarii]|uniref:Ribosome-binding factor A n=1 Tax=Aporhodopirellula aestuarii TaxID=2950107 RepID=A0ABT0U3I3_9BACT|nr:30S ribosome-binding factor RbfA [Aporhodopirellula aestuarii]MCM2371474.1 30S ribosome-binding factor RbfA [Aporhodopirellula aestuarii]
MSSRRQLKAAEAIREVVATSVLTDIRDPRVRDVTIISVSVSPDMREAKVSVSVMGDEAQKQLSIRGLQNSAGFLQSKIANRLDTRYTPRLSFELDKGQENALAVSEILARIAAEQSGETPAETPPTPTSTQSHAETDASSSEDMSTEDEHPQDEPTKDDSGLQS